MKQEYVVRLREVSKARSRIFWPDVMVGAAFLLGIIGNFIFPPVAAVFGVIAFYYAMKRLHAVARMPCPKCERPFGSESKMPLGVGGNTCQSCGLHMQLGEDKRDSWPDV